MSTLQQTSRFLMQASLGASWSKILEVSDRGIEQWIQDELNKPLPTEQHYERSTRQIWRYFRKRLRRWYGEAAINGDGNNPALPYKWYFHMAWWQQTLGSQEHLLRQRVAQALSELLVISDNSQLELDSIGMASYYDLLYKHAFGSYTDLLYDVTMHPCMGVYLSHMNNQKADPSKHIHPDENYAREIMQLFTIGLFEMNQDGNYKKDRQGSRIPTYDNRDIRELARVFTGLKASAYQYEWNTSFWDPSYNNYPVEFDDGIDKQYKTVPFVNMTRAMQVDEKYHDRGAKRLLKGRVKLQGSQSGQEEIFSLVQQLVAHPNTAPFVAKHLITQLVTSNPSTHYISTVAKAFGRHGDLGKAVQAVLTYPLHYPVSEQRLASQKLKSPLLRTTQLLRAFKVSNRSKKYWLLGDDIQESIQQHPLSAPTVFNFYKPDFTPHGALEKAKLLAPEFELHTSATSIAYVNMMYNWFFGEYYPMVSTQVSVEEGVINAPEMSPERLYQRTKDCLQPDFNQEIALARDPRRHDELIDQMSLLLTGKINLSIKNQIKSAYRDYQDNPLWVVQTIAFMLAISPEFTVQEQ